MVVRCAPPAPFHWNLWRICKMSKQAAVSAIPLLAAFTVLMLPRLQLARSDPPKTSTQAQNENWWLHHDKWDTGLPDKSAYLGRKTEPAPSRDISGTWDGVTEGGTQAKGAKEFPDDIR